MKWYSQSNMKAKTVLLLYYVGSCLVSRFVQNSAGNNIWDMTFTCIYFLQHCCCSDAHSQGVRGAQEGFIFAGVAEWQAGMMEGMYS